MPIPISEKNQITKDAGGYVLLFLWQYSTAITVHSFILVVYTYVLRIE